MRRKILSTLVFGSLMLVSWGQAEAAEGNQIYQLNPVVVTATRLKENAAEVPASVSVITADQIKQKMYEQLQKLSIIFPVYTVIAHRECQIMPVE